jgi:parvulin-like peptidyl-prolyl isomerase
MGKLPGALPGGEETEADERVDLKKEFKKVKMELMINRLIELSLEDDVQVTDEEVQAFYDDNKEDFVLNEDLVHAYHILAKTREEANAIRRRLRKGESFEDVSKDVRTDYADAAAWDLGYFSRDEVIPEISKVIFNMPSGALSLPIKSDYGYHIVKLIDKQKRGDYNKLENVQVEIKLKLEAIKKRERFQRFLSDLKNQTEIITNFQLLEKVNLKSTDQKEN